MHIPFIINTNFTNDYFYIQIILIVAKNWNNREDVYIIIKVDLEFIHALFPCFTYFVWQSISWFCNWNDSFIVSCCSTNCYDKICYFHKRSKCVWCSSSYTWNKLLTLSLNFCFLCLQNVFRWMLIYMKMLWLSSFWSEHSVRTLLPHISV